MTEGGGQSDGMLEILLFQLKGGQDAFMWWPDKKSWGAKNPLRPVWYLFLLRRLMFA